MLMFYCILWNELGKSDKMRGLLSISLLFMQRVKINNTEERMSASIYHMALKLLKNAFLG